MAVPILLILLTGVVLGTSSVQASDQVRNNGRVVNSAVAVDSTGDIVVTGSTAGFGRGQAMALLMKYASSGKLKCLKTFGPETTVLDTFGYGIAFDSSNNIYWTGSTQSFDGQRFHVFLIKFDSSCNLVYRMAWGGLGNDVGRGVTVDASDNVYVTGSTESYGAGQSEVFLLKYDAAGEFQFSQIWGGTQNSYGNAVAVDGSGNVYVTGVTNGNGTTTQAVFLLKYDFLGYPLYQKIWGGSLNAYASGLAIDGASNVYVTGYTYSGGVTQGVASVLLLKYDPSGNLLFQTTWGGKQNDYGSGVTVDGVGNVYITGYTYSSSVTPGVPSVFTLKYDQSGNLLFQNTWGGKRADYGYGIDVDPSGFIFVTGYTYSFGPNVKGDQQENQGTNVFLLKYDPTGNLLFQKTYGGGTPDH
jgi:hypothetical protein